MRFQDAVELCIAKKYADFDGMATRSECWWFALFVVVVECVMAAVNDALGGLFIVATITPLLAVFVRRLSDTGRSPWWLAFALVPVVGWLLVTIVLCQPGRSPTTPT